MPHVANGAPWTLCKYKYSVLVRREAQAHPQLAAPTCILRTRSRLYPFPYFYSPTPSHHEGLVNLSRRSRTLPSTCRFVGPTTRSFLIPSTEHGVFKRLDLGCELHEVGVYPLKSGLSASFREFSEFRGKF